MIWYECCVHMQFQTSQITNVNAFRPYFSLLNLYLTSLLLLFSCATFYFLIYSVILILHPRSYRETISQSIGFKTAWQEKGITS